MREMRLAILFSGNGSNLENIYKKMQNLIIDSAESQNLGGKSLSLRDSAKQNRGNPPCENNAELQGRLPRRFCESARNDEFIRDSSLRLRSAQNDNLRAENDNLRESAESALDSANLAKIKLNFALAISSKESAFGIQRCANLGLKCEIIDYKKNKENFFQKIMQILRDEKIDLVILAGFMKILPPTFTAKFRAINIHPSILPLFKGANAIKESFDSDMKIAGVSVHFVSDELDSGALIAQDIIHKIDGESFESFEARIHELEYEIYPRAIIKAIKIVGNSQNIGKNNPSLRDSAKQNRGKPPIEKNAKLQSGWLLHNARKSFGLPREQSSLAMTENNDFAESSLDSAENRLDSASSTQEANSSIADEFLGLCEASDEDRTLSPSRKRADALPKKSLRDAEFVSE